MALQHLRLDSHIWNNCFLIYTSFIISPCTCWLFWPRGYFLLLQSRCVCCECWKYCHPHILMHIPCWYACESCTSLILSRDLWALKRKNCLASTLVLYSCKQSSPSITFCLFCPAGLSLFPFSQKLTSFENILSFSPPKCSSFLQGVPVIVVVWCFGCAALNVHHLCGITVLLHP